MSHSPSGPEISFSLPHTTPTKQALASARPDILVQAKDNYHAAQRAITQGFYTPAFNEDATAWHQWRRFCIWFQITPNLKYIEDPIPCLQIFSERVCACLLSAQGQPIKKRLVKKYLRLIGQIFASVGSNNPLHNRMGKLNFRMGRQLASCQKDDSTPTRVWPLPIGVIQALYTVAQGTTARNINISNITCVAFFFLIRSGKYCKGGTDTAHHPFRLKDVQFFIGQQPYNSTKASNPVLAQADFAILLFVTQNNGVKDESIGHVRTAPPPKVFQWRPCVA